jgi:PBP1b-binding outer membrane lipoprotein LpoB
MRYLLILLLVSCVQTQAPSEKVYKKRFEVNKVNEKTFEIYY